MTITEIAEQVKAREWREHVCDRGRDAVEIQRRMVAEREEREDYADNYSNERGTK